MTSVRGYRPTPTTHAVALADGERTRANAVRLHSAWDVDIVKRVAKNSMGSKDSTFSGKEKNPGYLPWKNRNALWTSILKTAQQAFEANESGNDLLFDLADATKEANPIFNGILFFHVDFFDHPPLISSYFDECLKAIAASSSGPLDDRQAKRQLFGISRRGRLQGRSSLLFDWTPRFDKVDLEEIFAHVIEELVENFQFHIDAANEMLTSLNDNVDDDEPPRRWSTPSSDKPAGNPGVHPPPPGGIAITAGTMGNITGGIA
ncbi:hypothetical protein CYMTET_34199 [Cymbomonas tetramitiformis]|uniref:Uncharacterized protein n=1 Tax=Cymbomonas tetramitiformis TaxID=36881 RepID=A0AAE0FBK0_9CHLO|nr:hypothetical protein CYMTET_34199 [Cymbomonas tetramitiformis]